MLPVIYWEISNIEMSKRIFVYIFLLIIDHVCLLSIEMFEIYMLYYYVNKSNIVNKT